MKKGLNLIIECPVCGKSLGLIRYMHIYSYGAKTYSDGNITTPNFIKNIELGACPDCSNSFWLNDVKIIGEKLNAVDSFSEPLVMPLDLEGYKTFLDTNIATIATEKELYIRLEIWHLYNLFILNDGGEMDNYYLKNARSIIKVFRTENSVERITLAELCRNTGDFNKAIELLDYEFDSVYLPSVNLIKKKALIKDPFPFEIIQ